MLNTRNTQMMFLRIELKLTRAVQIQDLTQHANNSKTKIHNDFRSQNCNIKLACNRAVKCCLYKIGYVLTIGILSSAWYSIILLNSVRSYLIIPKPFVITNIYIVHLYEFSVRISVFYKK